ncbi:MAG TPA: DinB family protein [Longimicrobiaceae bacterium]|nr:DinB family protein [Longimicrobiaceae bacterium]
MNTSTTTITDRLIAELRTEAATTRRVLERVPEDQLSWKPHPKSMSIGQLALHIAGLPQGIAILVTELSVEAPVVPLQEARSRSEILAALDQSMKTAVEKLSEWGDEGLAAEWTLTAGGEVLVVQPRGEVVRMLMFNHWYHHRGQLTVYLRLLDIPVPPVYGPTADENPFG